MAVGGGILVVLCGERLDWTESVLDDDDLGWSSS